VVGWKPYYYNEVTQTFHSFFHPTAQDSGINKQWRICFKWLEGNAYDVEIVDYH